MDLPLCDKDLARSVLPMTALKFRPNAAGAGTVQRLQISVHERIDVALAHHRRTVLPAHRDLGEHIVVAGGVSAARRTALDVLTGAGAGAGGALSPPAASNAAATPRCGCSWGSAAA